MFRIGEFSQIAQVSSHLLRHYDNIGLLKPGHVDIRTGYRYYRVRQLSDLNRIIALKDLGFSLDEIAEIVSQDISVETIQEMLETQRAKTEENIRQEKARLHRIQSRLDQLGDPAPIDVVVKTVPKQQYLSAKCQMHFLDDGPHVVRSISAAVESTVRPKNLKHFMAIFPHDNFVEKDVTLQAGFIVAKPLKKSITINDFGEFAVEELPEVEKMATIVQEELHHSMFDAYETMGKWIATNQMQLDGPIRKIYLTPPDAENNDRALVELQFPVCETSEES